MVKGLISTHGFFTTPFFILTSPAPPVFRHSAQLIHASLATLSPDQCSSLSGAQVLGSTVLCRLLSEVVVYQFTLPMEGSYRF